MARSRSNPPYRNRRRGEVLIQFPGGDAYVARPSMAAVVEIEARCGSIADVACRLAKEPALSDTVEVLVACVIAGSEAPPPRERIIEGLSGAGMLIANDWALQLALSFFVRGKRAPAVDESKDESESSAGFPAEDFVGSAIALWGASPDEAWNWTAADWWCAYDAHAAIHGNGSSGRFSGDEAEQIARELRAEQRAERAEIEALLADRERMENEGAVAE